MVSILLVAACVVSDELVPVPTATIDGVESIVTIGDVKFVAEVVHTKDDRMKGLSGRDHMPLGNGMLFVFEDGVASSFWMKGMKFKLDFVWIGSNCEVVSTTVNVPLPISDSGTGLSSYASQTPAAYIFEINSGEVAEYGIELGDPVSFSGISVRGANC